MKKIIAILGAIGVTLGALGAHALAEVLTEANLASFKTGVSYHMIHTLAMLAVLQRQGYKLSLILWLVGIVLFSGSIYLLATDELMGLQLSFLGPVTPIGGLALIAGWLALFGSNETNVDK